MLNDLVDAFLISYGDINLLNKHNRLEHKAKQDVMLSQAHPFESADFGQQPNFV